MDQLNFIFTKNSFHIDEAKDSAWAELFKENKYTALYELGFKNNLKGLTPSNVIKLIMLEFKSDDISADILF